MMRHIDRYLLLYLGIVFPLTWGIIGGFIVFGELLSQYVSPLTLMHPITIFILYLPSIAGLVTYYTQGGIASVKGIFLKLIPKQKDLIWFPVMVGVVIVFVFCMHFGALLFGGQTPEITDTLPQIISKALWNFIEEAGLIGGIFGWVGFLLPFLQAKLKNNILSGLLTGFIFGLWVYPGYMMSPADSSYLLYVAQLMSFFVFISYVFNATQGNLSFYLLTFWLMATGSHIQLYFFNMQIQILQIIFFIVASIVIHSVFKAKKIRYPLQTFPDFIMITRTQKSISI